MKKYNKQMNPEYFNNQYSEWPKLHSEIPFSTVILLLKKLHLTLTYIQLTLTATFIYYRVKYLTEVLPC